MTEHDKDELARMMTDAILHLGTVDGLEAAARHLHESFPEVMPLERARAKLAAIAAGMGLVPATARTDH